MTERISHRRPADLVIGQLHDRILEGATLVATGEGDARLYQTPSTRYFTVTAGELRPVTEVDALDFLKGVQ